MTLRENLNIFHDELESTLLRSRAIKFRKYHFYFLLICIDLSNLVCFGDNIKFFRHLSIFSPQITYS